jgi:pimeloyl-ACP methyl ester carboxylesterase
VLLCPGHRRLLSSQDADALVTAFRALPKKTLRRVVLVHGTADATVPIADSRELATDRARLVEVPGGSHGLGAAAAEGLLSSVVVDVLAKKYGAGRVGEVFLFES